MHQEDQDLLIDQLSLMAKYSQVLEKRISRF
ncbi:crAss001_48 related protein [Morganella morganii]